MAQLNIKQIKGANTGSVLFLGQNGVVTENNSKFRWNNINSRLGINNSSPSGNLHIVGDANSDRLLVINDNSLKNLLQIYNNGLLKIGDPDVTPSLTLQSTNNTGNVFVMRNASGDRIFGVSCENSHAAVFMGNNTSGGSLLASLKDYSFFSLGEASPALNITGQTIFNQTHVGIGVSASIDSKLSVRKQRTSHNSDHYGQRIKIDGSIISSNNISNTTYGLYIDNTGTYIQNGTGTYSSVGLRIDVNGSNQNFGILVSGTSNNGFGTINPRARVHIESPPSNVPLLIASGSTTNDLVRFTQLGTGNIFVVNNSSNSNPTRFIINSDGNVGIGTQSNNSYALNISGDVNINGTLYATSKSFEITHPLDPNKKLIYGSLEGPEYGVYFRGKLDNENVINLPDYWSELVDESTISVNITPFDIYQRLFVDKIENNKVYISNCDGELPKCYYIVYGERKDIPKIL